MRAASVFPPRQALGGRSRILSRGRVSSCLSSPSSLRQKHLQRGGHWPGSPNEKCQSNIWRTWLLEGVTLIVLAALLSMVFLWTAFSLDDFSMDLNNFIRPLSCWSRIDTFLFLSQTFFLGTMDAGQLQFPRQSFQGPIWVCVWDRGLEIRREGQNKRARSKVRKYEKSTKKSAKKH